MKLSSIFSSHMVLPAGKALYVYGEGEGRVTVTLDAQTVSAVAVNGQWMATLSPMPYGGPYTMTVSCGEERIALDDVWVGEVYLCAGQSNMQFKLCESATAKAEWVGDSRIRLFSTNRPEGGERFRAEDGWVVCTDENAGAFTAIGYHVARAVAAEKNIAVGLVTCYQGASVIESWMPVGTCEGLGIHIPISEKFGDHTCTNYAGWNGDGMLYEKVLSQITPYAQSAVIWYQGESDVSTAEGLVYADELCALIRIWRRDFIDEALPFIVVQLADFDDRRCEGWTLVQEAQMAVPGMLPGVTTVVSRDICETDNIHPPTKHLLAARIAAAMADFA